VIASETNETYKRDETIIRFMLIAQNPPLYEAIFSADSDDEIDESDIEWMGTPTTIEEAQDLEEMLSEIAQYERGRDPNLVGTRG
jgi:hypothetical protein